MTEMVYRKQIRPVMQIDTQTQTCPVHLIIGGAFVLVNNGGQGQGPTADLPLFRRSNHPARMMETVIRRVWTVTRICRRVGTLLSALLSPQP